MLLIELLNDWEGLTLLTTQKEMFEVSTVVFWS